MAVEKFFVGRLVIGIRGDFDDIVAGTGWQAKSIHRSPAWRMPGAGSLVREVRREDGMIRRMPPKSGRLWTRCYLH